MATCPQRKADRVALYHVHVHVIGTGKAGPRALKVVARTEETYNIQGTAYQRELIGPILLITEK